MSGLLVRLGSAGAVLGVLCAGLASLPAVSAVPAQKLFGTPTKVSLVKNPQGINVTHDGRKVYMTHGDYLISIYDTKLKKVNVIDGVGNAIACNSIAVAPDDKHVYAVTMSDRYSFEGSVSEIDTATDQVTASVPVGQGAQGIAITPDGKHLYIASLYVDYVSVVDTQSLKLVRKIAIGRGGQVAVMSPDGKRAYIGIVDDRFNDRVAVIDTATGAVVAKIKIGGHPYGGAASPDGRRLYVATEDFGVVVIDTMANSVIRTLATEDFTGSGAHGVAVSRDGKVLYVTHEPFFISGFDTATFKHLGSVSVGGNPFGTVIAPDGKTLYVASSGQPALIAPAAPGDVLVLVPLHQTP